MVDKKLSVVIVTHNSAHCLNDALWIFEHGNLNIDFEIIIVDNASRDTSYIDSLDDKYTVIKNKKNVMFTLAVNQGMAIASGEIVLLLNPDVSWDNDLGAHPIEKMVSVLGCDPRNGIVGILQFLPGSDIVSFYEGSYKNANTDQLLNIDGVLFNWPKHIVTDDFVNKDKPFQDSMVTKEVPWVCGSVFMIKRELIQWIGLLPYNKTIEHLYSDITYCQLAKKVGWKVVTMADSYAYHAHGKSCR